MLWVVPLAVVSLLLVVRGWRMPGDGLDPSWHLVLEHAFLQDWTFGKDLIFTFGPWGFLYPKLFHSQLWGYIVAYEALLVCAWTGFFWRFRSGYTLALLIPLLLSPGLGAERAVMLLPLFAFLLVLVRTPWVWVAPYWVVSAWAANTKFTFFVTALALALAADLGCLSSPRKQWPVHTLTLLGFTLALFVFAGQPLTAFVPYLKESLDLAAGYGHSMNVLGSWLELAVFAFMSAAFLIAVGAGLWQHRLGPWRAVVGWLALAGLVFILFRGGFTRHDGHSLIAWGGLLGVITTAAAALTMQQRAVLRVLIGLSVVVLALGIYFQISYAKRLTGQAPGVFQAMIVPLERKAKDLLSANGLSDLRQLQQRRDTRTRQVLAKFRLEPPTGNVDVMPWNGSVPILAGWEFRPRPVFQSYAAYTDRQQTTMRRFIEHQGADNIYLTGAEIDQRWPGSSLGWSQLSLLSHYDLVGQTALGYHLRRRSQARSSTVSAPILSPAQAGEWIEIPDSRGPVILAADLDMTPAGRAVSLFLNPILLLEGQLADGRVVSHRVLPGLLRAGMVVSPYLSATGLPELFANETAGRSVSLPKVKRIRLVVSALASSMFADSFQFEFQTSAVYGEAEFSTPVGVREGMAGDKTLALASLAAKRWDGAQAKILKSATGKNLLDAHAGTRFAFDASELAGLSLSYGIRSGAWTQGQTNGVRIVISFTPQGEETSILLDRRLTPATVVSDQDQQVFRHQFDALQTGQIQIAVTDNGDPRWDWAYLTDMQFDATRLCVHDNPLQCISLDYR